VDFWSARGVVPRPRLPQLTAPGRPVPHRRADATCSRHQLTHRPVALLRTCPPF
jgi:hypothetical protein